MTREEALRLIHTILLSLFAATLLFARPVAAADGPEIYSFAADRLGGWRVGTADTVTESVRGGLLLRSNRSKYTYQIVTASIPVEAGRVYRLTYNMDLRAGSMIIGVQDAAKQSWIAQWPLKSKAGNEERFFQSATGKVNIVVANNNGDEIVSELLIASLKVFEGRPISAGTAATAAAGRFPFWRMESYNGLEPVSSEFGVTLVGEGNSGLYLRRDIDPKKTYRLTVDGKGAGDLRLRFGKQREIYHAAPEGALDYLVDNAEQIELLYFSGKPFTYEIRLAGIAECPNCITDGKLKTMISKAIPGVEQMARSKPLEAAQALLHWTSGTVDHGTSSHLVATNTARIEKMTAGESYNDIWLTDAGGTYCGGFAVFFEKVLALFDIPAFTIGIGIPDTVLTHVTTVVPLSTSSGSKFYVFDPTFNETYRVKSTNQLADIETILKAVAANQAQTIQPDSRAFTRTALVPISSLSAFKRNLAKVGAKADCPPEWTAGIVTCRNLTYSSALAFIDAEEEFRRYSINSRSNIIFELLKRGVNTISVESSDARRQNFEQILTRYGVRKP